MTGQGVMHVTVAAHVVRSSFPAILSRSWALCVVTPWAYHGHVNGEVIEWMTKNVWGD
jgi:hypothetical protein